MKMTTNGKLLLTLTAALTTTSFCTATFAGDETFLAIWMGGVSIITGFGAALSAVGCTADTFLENEE
jgi:hypothetical protein